MRTLQRFLTVFVVLSALWAPMHGHAQEPPGPTITVNQVDAGAYPDIRAVVTVLDGRGIPVQGLTAAQFQAFDGQEPLPFTDVQAALDDALPLSVIVTIDVSGSMAGERMEQAKQAATTFVQSLGANDQAAIMSFSDRVTTVVPLTNDRLKLTNGIAGLQASGATALYEAVQTSASTASSASSQRRAVIILTDGENEAPASTATRVGSLAAARGAGVPVFAISVGATIDTAYLQELSTSTNGRYVEATPASIGGVYSAIATVLRNQYVVNIRATKPADGADASLQLLAFVAGAPATTAVAFKRGTAPAIPAASPVPVTSPGAANDTTTGSSGNLKAYVFGAVGLTVLACIALFALYRWQRRRALKRAQLKVVEPNVRQAAAQPLPAREGQLGVNGATETGTGRLVEKGGEGRTFHLRGGPIVIGSSPTAATVVLNGGGVAPEHTRIWLRDGKYLLHHVGGLSRKTLVAGKSADWVTLEPGDELQIGTWHFVFEDGA